MMPLNCLYDVIEDVHGHVRRHSAGQDRHHELLRIQVEGASGHLKGRTIPAPGWVRSAEDGGN